MPTNILANNQVREYANYAAQTVLREREAA